MKCYIISAVIWLHYLQSSVFISISQTQMKLEPPPTSASGVHQRGISVSEYVWENHDLTEQPVITSVYWVHEVMHTRYCLCYFSKPSCNGPETELKRKIGIRENISLVFYHIKTVGA